MVIIRYDMSVFNERFALKKLVQEKDQFGSLSESFQFVGEFWCEEISSSCTVQNMKGGRKRTQFVELQTWLCRIIDHTCIVKFHGIDYRVVNAVHSRGRGLTTIQCEFTN